MNSLLLFLCCITITCSTFSYVQSLHLKNLKLLEENSNDATHKFGFYITVCCGKIPVNNQWNDDWMVRTAYKYVCMINPTYN